MLRIVPNVVADIRYKNGWSSDITSIRDCEACIKGKAHTIPYPSKATHRAEKVLELVHTDVCVMPVSSRDGHRYFVSFIDDYSRYAMIYLLRKKSEAMRAFHHYKVLMEKQTDMDIKSLRSDGGGEYVSKQFKQCWQMKESNVK